MLRSWKCFHFPAAGRGEGKTWQHYGSSNARAFDRWQHHRVRCRFYVVALVWYSLGRNPIKLRGGVAATPTPRPPCRARPTFQPHALASYSSRACSMPSKLRWHSKISSFRTLTPASKSACLIPSACPSRTRRAGASFGRPLSQRRILGRRKKLRQDTVLFHRERAPGSFL